MNLLTVLPLLFAQAPADRAAPFFDAIRKGDAGAVRVLLSSDPTLAAARNADGATPALWAAYTRHPELAPTVLAGRDPDFFEACALGNIERASALLARDPKLKSSTYQIEVRVWLSRDGRFEREEIVRGTGDRELDALIRSGLNQLSALQQPVPQNLPQPLRIRVTSSDA